VDDGELEHQVEDHQRLWERLRIPAKADTHSGVKPDRDSDGSGTTIPDEAEQRRRDADGCVKE
jgi:hypothetical protein